MGETTPQINERRFFAEWMLTFLSFPLGGIMALAFGGPMEDAVSAASSGAVAGVVIGLAQLIILRRHVGMTAGWLVSTVTGLTLGNTIGVLLSGGGTQTGDLLIVGAAAGISVGIIQWAMLRGIPPAGHPLAAGRYAGLAAGLARHVEHRHERPVGLRRFRVLWRPGLRGLDGRGACIYGTNLQCPGPAQGRRTIGDVT